MYYIILSQKHCSDRKVDSFWTTLHSILNNKIDILKMLFLEFQNFSIIKKNNTKIKYKSKKKNMYNLHF